MSECCNMGVFSYVRARFLKDPSLALKGDTYLWVLGYDRRASHYLCHA